MITQSHLRSKINWIVYYQISESDDIFGKLNSPSADNAIDMCKEEIIGNYESVTSKFPINKLQKNIKCMMVGSKGTGKHSLINAMFPSTQSEFGLKE